MIALQGRFSNIDQLWSETSSVDQETWRQSLQVGVEKPESDRIGSDWQNLDRIGSSHKTRIGLDFKGGSAINF